MAGKSTNSKNSQKSKNGDSQPDSDEMDSLQGETTETDTAPVVIEGEADDVTEDLNDANVSGEPDGEEALSNADDSAPQDTVSAEVEAQDNTIPPAPSPVVVETKRSSFVPLVVGGVLAGMIGFFASHLGVFPVTAIDTEEVGALDSQVAELTTKVGTLSEAQSGLAAEVAEIGSTDEPLAARLDEISDDLSALKNTVAQTGETPSGVIERIEALEADVASGMADLTNRLSGLEDRLADIQIAQAEDATGDMSEEQLASFQGELEKLTAEATAQVEEAKARASAFEAEAAAAAAVAERSAAIAALTSAVENGAAFQQELAFFDDPPKALSATAETGVPTLSALQRDFPQAARAALSVATVVPQDASASERLTAFLKRQTNARSLAPKEGDGTDAILSRAEASISNGDLVGSLAELSSLSDAAKEAVGPWMSNAQARLDALAALSDLSAAEN